MRFGLVNGDIGSLLSVIALSSAIAKSEIMVDEIVWSGPGPASSRKIWLAARTLRGRREDRSRFVGWGCGIGWGRGARGRAGRGVTLVEAKV
jgi:hypothetical protein